MNRYPPRTQSLTVIALLLTTMVPCLGQSSRVHQPCGTPVSGIALCLSQSAAPDGVTLEIKNRSGEGLILQLGVVFAMGAKQYPTAIRLLLSDAQGKKHWANPAEPAGVIGGQFLPLIVSLPAGASVKLPVQLTKCFWHTDGQLEDFEPSTKKRYLLKAQFTGTRYHQSDADPDLKGISLWHFWEGIANSNAISLGPE